MPLKAAKTIIHHVSLKTRFVILLQTYIVLRWRLYVIYDSSCIYLRFMLFLTFLLFVADTVLKPQIKNKKTVSRPAEKDFKATNVSAHDVLFIYLNVTTLKILKLLVDEAVFIAATCLCSREASCETSVTRCNIMMQCSEENEMVELMPQRVKILRLQDFLSPWNYGIFFFFKWRQAVIA